MLMLSNQSSEKSQIPLAKALKIKLLWLYWGNFDVYKNTRYFLIDWKNFKPRNGFETFLGSINLKHRAQEKPTIKHKANILLREKSNYFLFQDSNWLRVVFQCQYRYGNWNRVYTWVKWCAVLRGVYTGEK